MLQHYHRDLISIVTSRNGQGKNVFQDRGKCQANFIFLGQFQEILKRDVCGSHGETFKQHEQEIYNT